MSAWDDMVLVGRIARPHGLRGQVAVNPETDFVETRFAPGKRVSVNRAGATCELTVASLRVQNGRPIVAFVGYERIEDVEPLIGCELRIPEDALETLGDGQFYEHQLVGCRVETLDGTAVGPVVRVEGGAGGSRLVVEGGRGEVLIPFVAAICSQIDVRARQIRIDPPEGLLALNDGSRRP